MRSLGALALVATSCGAVTGIEVTAPPTTPVTTNGQASAFELRDAAGQATSLSSLLARGDVALIFYRGHW